MSRTDYTSATRAQTADPATKRHGAPEAEFAESASTGLRPQLSDEEITAKLNEVLAKEPTGLDPVIARMQAKSIGPSDW